MPDRHNSRNSCKSGTTWLHCILFIPFFKTSPPKQQQQQQAATTLNSLSLGDRYRIARGSQQQPHPHQASCLSLNNPARPGSARLSPMRLGYPSHHLDSQHFPKQQSGRLPSSTAHVAGTAEPARRRPATSMKRKTRRYVSKQLLNPSSWHISSVWGSRTCRSHHFNPPWTWGQRHPPLPPLSPQLWQHQRPWMDFPAYRPRIFYREGGEKFQCEGKSNARNRRIWTTPLPYRHSIPQSSKTEQHHPG